MKENLIMENRELISIIAPVFNTKEYLNTCLESLINQTYRNLEIILVDDGSYDGSQYVCDEFAKRDYRIKVIHKDNEGVVSARKTGICVAQGDLIGFVDSDDWIELNMYERLYHYYDKEKTDIVMCGRYDDTAYESRPRLQGIDAGRYDCTRLKSEVFPRMVTNEAFFRWGIFPSYWDKLFKKELIMSFLLNVDNRITMGEDAAGVYTCLLNSKSIYIIGECLYHYRQLPFSMVTYANKDQENERMRYKVLYNTVLEELQKNTEIYDCTEQWKKYILFLLVPRADMLYKDIEKLDYLFPFTDIKRGTNVIIYGAGLWGSRLYAFLKRTKFCNVVGIADKNTKSIYINEIDILSPDRIDEVDHDSVIVAASFADARNDIEKYLRLKYPNDSIAILDENEVFSDRTLKAFGIK
ncbi:MAG: glycosyltransferase, partial [Lachnospiraceae bacterium]|nr:glycosyltransferase [Lachnospiraceae bacterium]